MIYFDELFHDGPQIARTEESFKLSTDSVLLSHFVNATNPKNIIDLGSGAGVLTVLMAHKYKKAQVLGAEIQEESVNLSRLSVEKSGFSDRVNIKNCDLREFKNNFTAGAYDLVVSNPPYFPIKSGYSAPLEARKIAREEICCTLNDVLTAAAYLCKWGGAFFLVHRPERIAEICAIATQVGLEPKRLRVVQYKIDSAPSLVLVECKRGAKAGLIFEKPLILTNEDGSDSQEVLEIYKR